MFTGKPSLVVILALGAISAPVHACDLFDTRYPAQSHHGVDSVVMKSPGVCFSVKDGMDYVANTFSALRVKPGSNQFDVGTSYWDQWLISGEYAPFLTQRLSNNYFGVGVWLPEELEQDVHMMTYEEWLLSHGLQFSFGIGDKSAGEPRLRFDYRWHESYQGDIFMQFEIPID